MPQDLGARCAEILHNPSDRVFLQAAEVGWSEVQKAGGSFVGAWQLESHGQDQDGRAMRGDGRKLAHKLLASMSDRLTSVLSTATDGCSRVSLLTVAFLSVGRCCSRFNIFQEISSEDDDGELEKDITCSCRAKTSETFVCSAVDPCNDMQQYPSSRTGAAWPHSGTDLGGSPTVSSATSSAVT